MRKALALALCLAGSPAIAADQAPVVIDTSPDACVDAPPGRAMQLVCTEAYRGTVRPKSAKICRLPDGTWTLNMKWDCDVPHNK